MQLGIQLNPYYPGSTGNPWDAVMEAARAVDASRLDSLWLYDHFLYEGGYSAHPVPEPVMECFTTLGAIASITSRVRLGQLVLGIPYRNPAMLAKMATSLDLISHGRTILGLGAGWHRREYEGFGWGAWEPAPVRLKRLEEAVQVIQKLWTEQPASFEGEYYRLESVMDNPRPVQSPHPPIMIAGSGEKVTLRLVAQYGQFCNVSGSSEDVSRLFQTLADHCERVGRDVGEITRSVYSTVLVGRDAADIAAKRERLEAFLPTKGAITGTADEVADELAAYERAGCQYMIFRTPDWNDPETIQLISDRIAPALQ